MSSKLFHWEEYSQARFGDLEAGDVIWNNDWPHRV